MFPLNSKVRYRKSDAASHQPPSRQGRTATVIEHVNDGTALQRVTVRFDDDGTLAEGVEAARLEAAES